MNRDWVVTSDGFCLLGVLGVLCGTEHYLEDPSSFFFLVANSQTVLCFLWTRVNCSLLRGLVMWVGFVLFVCESVIELSCWPPVVT